LPALLRISTIENWLSLVFAEERENALHSGCPQIARLNWREITNKFCTQRMRRNQPGSVRWFNDPKYQ